MIFFSDDISSQVEAVNCAGIINSHTDFGLVIQRLVQIVDYWQQVINLWLIGDQKLLLR